MNEKSFRQKGFIIVSLKIHLVFYLPQIMITAHDSWLVVTKRVTVGFTQMVVFPFPAPPLTWPLPGCHDLSILPPPRSFYPATTEQRLKLLQC